MAQQWIKPIKPVVLDQQLFKQFKNDSFHKIDLHGCTVDEAHQKVLSYLTNHSKKKTYCTSSLQVWVINQTVMNFLQVKLENNSLYG